MKSRPTITKPLLALLLATGVGVIVCFVTPVATPLHRVSATAHQHSTAAAHSQMQFARKALPAASQNTQALPKVLHGMPLSFAENCGQVDARAAFHLQGRNTAAYFTGQGLTAEETAQLDAYKLVHHCCHSTKSKGAHGKRALLRAFHFDRKLDAFVNIRQQQRATERRQSNYRLYAVKRRYQPLPRGLALIMFD